MRKAAEDSK